VEVLLGSSSSRFASALAETSGNMEVGVVEPQFFFRGDMDASASTFLAITNNSDIFLRGIPLTFGIQPGEVILFDFAGRNFRDAGAPHARISATIFMERFADTGGGPIETIPLFDYTLDVRGGFGQIALDNPLNLVLEPVFDLDLGMIGFKSPFFESSVELPEIAPGELVVVNYVMAAHGDSGLFEQGFSAKIGDPFDLTGGAFLRINPVPEPATLAFLCLGLILLCLTRQRFRLSSR